MKQQKHNSKILHWESLILLKGMTGTEKLQVHPDGSSIKKKKKKLTESFQLLILTEMFFKPKFYYKMKSKLNF